MRSNFIIEIEKYFDIESKINEIKKKYGIEYNVEIKWAHLGSRINNRSDVPHSLTADEIRSYITEVVQFICDNEYGQLYYTLTDNNSIGKVDEVKLINMHLQNAFQRAQKEAETQKGYAVVIADDMNAQNKHLKKAIYQLTTEGDRFTEYPNVFRGLLVDFSDISCGLQVADLLAGIFTATLKHESVLEGEKIKFDFGYTLFKDSLYKIIRYSDYFLPEYRVYTYGIKEIPSNTGKEIAKSVSRILDEKLYDELVSSVIND